MIVFVAGCSTLPQPVFSPDQPHLKVITYNINWGIVKPDNVVDFLAGSDADVICLQETHKQWEAVLKLRLEERYPYCVFKKGGGAGGIAVMSKYKLSGITLLEPAAGWFPALLVEVHTPIGLLQFLNVHLRPPLSDRGSATVSAYYNTPGIHQKELQGFIAKTDSQKPLIVAGDFNEDEKGKALQWLLEHGFTDSLSMYDSKSKTWEWKVFHGVTLKDRYDHIIISEHLKCTGACVMRVKASDHMPVLAVIVLKNSGTNQCNAVKLAKVKE